MRLLVVCDLEATPLDLEVVRDPANACVIVCGDVYNDTLRELLSHVTVPVLGVHGNHDDENWPAVDGRGITDLHLTVVEMNGLRFGGFEGAWRYKPRGRFLYEDDEVEARLAEFPAVDVFVAHNPLAGLHDIDDGVHNGFQAFRDYVRRTRPKLFLHGHSNRPGEAALGDTRVICTRHWQVVTL